MTSRCPRNLDTQQVAFSYDDLDRIATRDTASFAYTGFNLDPTSDGTTIYSRSPAGRLLALNDGTGGKLANLDRHGDLVGLLDTAGTPTATRSYTPFGQIHTSVGTFAGQAGFQGDWTDPASGEVWQGARWYQPNTGTFTARDTVFGELATPMTLNRYLYANANPLNYFDPDGRFSMHLAERSSSTYVKKMVSSSTSRAKAYAPVAKARARAETQRKVNAARPLLARDNARKPTTVVAKATQTRITASLAKANRSSAVKPVAKPAIKPKPVVKPKPPVKPSPKPKSAWDKAKSAVGNAAGAVGRNAKKVVTSDITQGVLDACGLVPVVGEGCDLANAGSYAWEGDKVNAALSLAAAIPVAGTAATAGKYAVKYGDNAVNIGRRAVKTPRGTSPTYNQLRAAGRADAHHVIQDAAVRDVPGYSRGRAPAIQLDGPSTRPGTPHYNATQVQRAATTGGTYGAERQIAACALRAAGCSPGQITDALTRADAYFMDRLGLRLDSPLRIPGNRRIP